MRRALLASALLMLAACAQLQTRVPANVEFELTGKLAARYGDQAFSGDISWRHAADSDEMLITTPLGAGIARIVREDGSIVLTTAEPREYHARSAEALTEKVLGFRLPLVGLADWVRGRASRSQPAKTAYGENGRLRSLEQGGWTIEFLAYDDGHPSRMRLLYPGIELRLAISQWK